MKKRKALALLSGGLDSTLAVKVILDQGIAVEALNFTSPFCTCTGKNRGCKSEAIRVAEEFNIHKYLEDEFHNQPVIRARLRFIPQAAHIVTNNSLAWELIQQNPDGSVDATLTAPDLPWLASTALSLGNWVTVLEPQELRDMVLEWAQATANLYQIPPGSNKPISIGE